MMTLCRSLINITMDESFKNPVIFGYKQATNMKDLSQLFKQVYCSYIGFEIAHLPDAELGWITTKIEAIMTTQLSAEAKRDIARLLIETEAFDLFMQKRFTQVKRYGLEGCESAAVAFDVILKTAANIDHALVTMPHRGRLNLMTVLMNYPPTAIFHKLMGYSELPEGKAGATGDVLSHLSLQRKVNVSGNEAGLVTLLPNPSHLEAGNAMGLGAVYAYQKYKNERCLSVQFHGDAAFTGQGVVIECLQLSRLPNFSVDGTIHIICNNQLGFTTPADYGRSSKYASDPVKTIDAPIFHVNADCPEDVTKAAFIAVQYQNEFRKDAVLDLIGWRKMGHNELDEPMFTQPQMYEKIRNRPSTAQSYGNKILEAEEITTIERNSFEKLEKATEQADDYKPELIGIQKDWIACKNRETGATKELLVEAARQSVSYPVNEGFRVHPRLQKHHIEARLNQLKTEEIDWGTAEAMAFGSLLAEGFNVRLSGQDVARGTFSHRHLKFHDQDTGKEWAPFDSWPKSQGKLELAPSNLSEFSVLGFEYGLSVVAGNKTLPIWEAQFGDFFNGAQIVFDAFVSSGEAKWGLSSNLTVLLPHGYDGAGPEHSSCRLERFLQSCDESAEGNWIVAYPTTPANYFHLLRRQMKGKTKKPLIIAGPKTLLRSPLAISPLNAFVTGTQFQPVLVKHFGNRKNKKLICMTGKFYYEVAKELELCNANCTIIRFEQLNPFPSREEILKQTGGSNEYESIIWCQEEPKNMGAYTFVYPKLVEMFGKPLEFVGREASAAPATGISKLHKQQVQDIFAKLKQ